LFDRSVIQVIQNICYSIFYRSVFSDIQRNRLLNLTISTYNIILIFFVIS